MQGDRFILADNYDEGSAILDLNQPTGAEQIVILLPVYIWALEPLVELMNQLDRAAKQVE